MVQTPVLLHLPVEHFLVSSQHMEGKGRTQEQERRSHGFPCSRMKVEGQHLLYALMPLFTPSSFLAGWSPLTWQEVEV